MGILTASPLPSTYQFLQAGHKRLGRSNIYRAEGCEVYSSDWAFSASSMEWVETLIRKDEDEGWG